MPPSLRRPHRLAWPRTPPFHGGNTGSNPVGDVPLLPRGFHPILLKIKALWAGLDVVPCFYQSRLISIISTESWHKRYSEGNSMGLARFPHPNRGFGWRRWSSSCLGSKGGKLIRVVVLMVLGILVCQRLGGTTSLILLLVVIATIVVWSGIQGYRR